MIGAQLTGRRPVAWHILQQRRQAHPTRHSVTLSRHEIQALADWPADREKYSSVAFVLSASKSAQR